MIRIHRNTEQVFLAEISDKRVLGRIRESMNKGKRSNAIVTAFLNEESLKEIKKEDYPRIKADLILTETAIHYDMN